MNALQSLQSLCSAKLQSPENWEKWAALQSLQSNFTAKPPKTLGFLRFAALQSLHSPTGRKGRCKAGPSLTRGDAPGGFENA